MGTTLKLELGVERRKALEESLGVGVLERESFWLWVEDGVDCDFAGTVRAYLVHMGLLEGFWVWLAQTSVEGWREWWEEEQRSARGK